MVVTYIHVIIRILLDTAKIFIAVTKETQTARAETNSDLISTHVL